MNLFVPLMTVAILSLQDPPTDKATPPADVPRLEQIDAFVKELLEKEGVPGLSIAISKEGQTLLAKQQTNIGVRKRRHTAGRRDFTRIADVRAQKPMRRR